MHGICRVRTSFQLALIQPEIAADDFLHDLRAAGAAVNGLALGGGCELTLVCDIVIASNRATFGMPTMLEVDALHPKTQAFHQPQSAAGKAVTSSAPSSSG